MNKQLVTSLVEHSTIFMGNIPLSLPKTHTFREEYIEHNTIENNDKEKYFIINGIYISQHATSLEEVYEECQQKFSQPYLFLHKEQFHPVYIHDIIAIEAYKDKKHYSDHHEHFKCKYIALIKKSDLLYSIIEEPNYYRLKKIALFPSVSPESMSQETYDTYPNFLLKRKGIYSIQSIFKSSRLLKISPDTWKWDINIYKFIPHN